jgi:hypothetical protein
MCANKTILYVREDRFSVQIKEMAKNIHLQLLASTRRIKSFFPMMPPRRTVALSSIAPIPTTVKKEVSPFGQFGIQKVRY